MANANLYAQLRPHFPARLDDVAIETADAPASHEGHPFTALHYTWRDLERGSARSQAWYRWYNEVPALALLAIVILAVVKPAL